jgi:hypothetical protein
MVNDRRCYGKYVNARISVFVRRNISDQARTDSAAIESELEVIQAPIARLPTGGDLAKGRARDNFSAAAALVILWAEGFWHL